MNVLHPKKSYKLNYIAVVPPLMGILSEIGVWMPILNIFSIFLGIMGIVFGILHIVKIKKTTKRKIGEFGLIAIGNITWIVAMLTCAIMKFSSASYADNTSSDFINQLTGFGYSTGNHKQIEEKSLKQENTGTQIKSKTYDINDTAEFEGLKITITDVKKNFKMVPENSEPRQGSQFVKVDVKIENDSNSELNVSENDIKIQDSQGAVETPTPATYVLDDRFESADLIPGGVREGAVIFEVPENDSELKVIYTFPNSDGQRAEFDL